MTAIPIYGKTRFKILPKNQKAKERGLDAFWSSAGKELTSWLSFVMSNFDFVTLPLVYCLWCGA